MGRDARDRSGSDARVRIQRNKVNVGPYVSKNVALSDAKGDYITGHDADDWAHPQRLEHHLREVLPNESAMRASLTHMVRIDPTGRFVRIGKVSIFSFDGVARVSSISYLFDRDLLTQRLGVLGLRSLWC